MGYNCRLSGMCEQEYLTDVTGCIKNHKCLRKFSMAAIMETHSIATLSLILLATYIADMHDNFTEN